MFPVQLMDCYQRAAQKEPDAMFALAFHYAEGSCIEQNYEEAAKLINEFTNLGYGKTISSEDLEKRIFKLPDIDFPEKFSTAITGLFKSVNRTIL